MSIRTQAPQAELVGEQTAGSLVRNVWRVYRRNFSGVFLTSALVLIPLIALEALFSSIFPNLKNFAPTIVGLGMFAVLGPVTITLSDICVGNVPTVRRSYEKYFRHGLWLRVIGVLLLAYLYIILMSAVIIGSFVLVGLLLSSIGASSNFLLVFGGIGIAAFYCAFLWLAIRMQFIQTIAILEGRFGNNAFRRSFNLTRGQVWRLFGLYLLIVVIAYFALFACTILIELPIKFIVPNFQIVLPVAPNSAYGFLNTGSSVANVIYGICNVLIFPFIALGNILLYYDQRVRRESYDAKGLYEDLMR